MILIDFQLIIIIIVTIQVVVLNCFSWNSHGWSESTHVWILFFFFNNWSNRTTSMVENVPLKLVFLVFIQPVWGFWGKNFESCIRYPISHRKGYIHFCRPTPHSLKNGHASQKLFFVVILEIFFFFQKNCYMKNIQNLISYKKVYVDFCRQTPLPLKMVMSSHKWYFTIFSEHKLKNIHEVFLHESILIRKKILWRINFVLIQFAPNALLFEKLQN